MGGGPNHNPALMAVCIVQVVLPLDARPEAAHTAQVVNALSAAMQEALRAHPINAQRAAAGKPPANLVLLRGCGSRCATPFEPSNVHFRSGGEMALG